MEDLIKALQIFLKYGNPDNPTGSEHDELRVYIDPIDVLDVDKAALEALGFDVDEDLGDCFISYRFGSA